jgi:hypothetical protein
MHLHVMEFGDSATFCSISLSKPMNLFLPYPDDLAATARFLDDGRLNKQVVEAYQIGRIALKATLDPNAKIGWRNHPSSLLVINAGHPKIPWLQKYIEALDEEWRFRGFRRSNEFTAKIISLFSEADFVQSLFSKESVCTFVGDGKVIDGDSNRVGELYREYLVKKFENQARMPKWTGRTPPVIFKERRFREINYSPHF